MSDISNITTLSALTDEETIFCDGDWIESKDQDENGKVRLIQLADIGDGEFRDRSNRFMTSKRAKELNCTFLKKNDVLIARMPDPLGRACIFPLEEENTYVTVVDVAVFRPNLKKVNPNYIAHIVNSPQFRNEINSRQSGTTRRRISRSNLGQIDLPVPIKKDQDKCVIKIDSLFSQVLNATAELQTAQEKLSLFKQSILNSAIRGKLVPQDPKDEPASKLLERIQKEKEKLIAEKKIKKEKPLPPINLDEVPFELPEGWEWVRWGDLTSGDQGFKRGPFGSAITKSMFVKHSPYKIYEQYCPINDDCSYARYFITKEKFEEMEAFSVKDGDLLISCSGVTLGRITEVPENGDKGIINQALLRIRLRRDIIINSYFILFFRSKYFQTKIFELSPGSAQPNLAGVKVLKDFLIPIPPINEQIRIVKAVNEALDSAASIKKILEGNLEKSQLLKQSILKKAFEGELV